MRLFLKDEAEARVEGERSLRRLGTHAIEELRSWIARTEKNLARARELLNELEQKSVVETESESVQPFLVRKLEEGWRRLREGDYKQARSIADALLVLDPDSALLFDYRRLERACERRALAGEVLEPSFEFRQQVYEAGEQPVIVFRLTNHQKDQLVIRAQKGILGTLTVKFDRRFVGGSSRSDTHRDYPITTFKNVQRLVIPGGRSKEFEIPVRLDDSLPERGFVVRLESTGRFRPSQWGVEGRNVNLALMVPRAECWIVPEGKSDLTRTPLRKVKVALLLHDLESLHIAAQSAVWLARHDDLLTERLLKLLVGALPDMDDREFEIVNRLLFEASGLARDRSADREFWKDWLARRYPTAPADDDLIPPHLENKR